MKTYSVRLSQCIREVTFVEVDAKSMQDAEEIALDIAESGELEWDMTETVEGPTVLTVIEEA